MAVDPRQTYLREEYIARINRVIDYIQTHLELTDQEYAAAWNLIYGEWLPQSGYQPDDRPAYELYLNNAEEHPEHKHIVDICVPVKPI